MTKTVLLAALLASLLLAAPASADPTGTGPSGKYAAGDAQINTATAPASRTWLVTNTCDEPLWVFSSTLAGPDVSDSS